MKTNAKKWYNVLIINLMVCIFSIYMFIHLTGAGAFWSVCAFAIALYPVVTILSDRLSKRTGSDSARSSSNWPGNGLTAA